MNKYRFGAAVTELNYERHQEGIWEGV